MHAAPPGHFPHILRHSRQPRWVLAGWLEWETMAGLGETGGFAGSWTAAALVIREASSLGYTGSLNRARAGLLLLDPSSTYSSTANLDGYLSGSILQSHRCSGRRRHCRRRSSGRGTGTGRGKVPTLPRRRVAVHCGPRSNLKSHDPGAGRAAADPGSWPMAGPVSRPARVHRHRLVPPLLSLERAGANRR